MLIPPSQIKQKRQLQATVEQICKGQHQIKTHQTSRLSIDGDPMHEITKEQIMTDHKIFVSC